MSNCEVLEITISTDNILNLVVFILFCLSYTSSLFNQYVSALKYKYNHINVSVNDFLKMSWINKSDLENCAEYYNAINSIKTT